MEAIQRCPVVIQIIISLRRHGPSVLSSYLDIVRNRTPHDRHHRNEHRLRHAYATWCHCGMQMQCCCWFYFSTPVFLFSSFLVGEVLLLRKRGTTVRGFIGGTGATVDGRKSKSATNSGFFFFFLRSYWVDFTSFGLKVNIDPLNSPLDHGLIDLNILL